MQEEEKKKGWKGREEELNTTLARTGFERERCDVDDDFGTRFEYDEKHADRT